MSVKRDIVKQKWEDAESTEFPLVCETCLGDNPYVRMTKEEFGKTCKICHNPFTVFAWQAGTRGRVKRVEICKTCAKTKNVCQVCIFDLQYGLPVQLRDKVLAQEGASSVLSLTAMPQSDSNRAWFHAMNQRALESQGGTAAVDAFQDMATLQATATLQSMARMEPRYQRNLPKLCSFYARGECNRGADCPFRHEMPRDRNDPLSKQNTVDRFYGNHDPLAMKTTNAPRPKTASSTSATYNQLRYGPKTDAAYKTHAMANNNAAEEIETKDERAVATLYVRFDTNHTNLPVPNITEADLRDAFYSFGEIVSVRMHANTGAFIEYSTGQATELAILSMNHKWILNHQVRLICQWARIPKRGSQIPITHDKTSLDGTDSTIVTIGRPLPPPGVLQHSITETTDTALPKFTTVAPSSFLSSMKMKRSGDDLVQSTCKKTYPSSDPTRLGTQA